MGLKDKMIKKANELEERRPRFTPLELNEGNVQAIFNRCIATEGTPDDKCYSSILFSTLRGYSLAAERRVVFDKERTQANKKSIKYLYGQLKTVHSRTKELQINDAFYSYSGKAWTSNKGVLLEFLYLGAINDEHPLMSIFDSKTDSALLALESIKPTLSPKDPAFPAWWEAHKSEWEQ